MNHTCMWRLEKCAVYCVLCVRTCTHSIKSLCGYQFWRVFPQWVIVSNIERTVTTGNVERRVTFDGPVNKEILFPGTHVLSNTERLNDGRNYNVFTVIAACPQIWNFIYILGFNSEWKSNLFLVVQPHDPMQYTRKP